MHKCRQEPMQLLSEYRTHRLSIESSYTHFISSTNNKEEKEETAAGSIRSWYISLASILAVPIYWRYDKGWCSRERPFVIRRSRKPMLLSRLTSRAVSLYIYIPSAVSLDSIQQNRQRCCPFAGLIFTLLYIILLSQMTNCLTAISLFALYSIISR